MKYFDSENLAGVEVTPAAWSHKFWEALSTRAPEGDPLIPLKVFLFYNSTSLIDFLRDEKTNGN